MNRLRRFVLITSLGLLALFGVAFISFVLWMQFYIGGLEERSNVIATAQGGIEYAVLGAGTPILYLHGTPGGFDQSENRFQTFPELSPPNSQQIFVSRPGYLRTPAESGETIAEEADLYAALLDELNIDQAVVYAVSGGGLAGLQFAIRHPERCLGLILYAPEFQTQNAGEGISSISYLTMLLSDLGIWFVSPFVSALGESFSSEFDASSDMQIELLKSATRSLVPRARREPGVALDVSKRSNIDIDEWDLENLSVATKLIHGNRDENSSYEHSVEVVARIPNSEVETFENGDHYISITRAEEVSFVVNEFILEL